MEHKNQYSVIAFLSTGEVKKWNYVNDLQSFAKFLDKKHASWMYFNLYDRQSRKYLKRFYKGNFIPRYLLTKPNL